MNRAQRVSRSRAERFRRALDDWEPAQQRTFFWRERKLDRYEMLVVEVLLARTRAEAAEPVASALLARYPTVEDIARAELEDIEEMLYPLGLHRKRARALLATANALVRHHGAQVPDSTDELLELPYIGRYAANAIQCFHAGARRAVVDANVARVLRRYFGLPKPTKKLDVEESYWDLAGRLIPRAAPREHNWALLDLGATICRPRSPKCERCPLAAGCKTALSRGGASAGERKLE